MNASLERRTVGAGWTHAAIVDRRLWAEGLVTLRLEADTEPFRAGQFFNLAMPLEQGWVRRSYSAASAPGEPLEFFIARVEEGDLTPALTDLPVGAEVQIERQAHGFFVLEKVPVARDLWLVATGTGLGPFIAMLRTGEPWKRFQRVVVVHGVRRADHLAYAEELAAFGAMTNRPLIYVPVVSREEPGPGALPGRVTTALREGNLERQAGLALHPEQSQVMLCGNPAMIEEMVPILAARGLRRHRLRSPGNVSFEKYW